MADRKLVEYLRANAGRQDPGELKKALLQQGWSQDDISAAMNEIGGSGAQPAKESPPAAQPAGGPGIPGPGPAKQEKKKGNKKLIAALIILVILILLFIYVAADIISYFNNMFPESALPFEIPFLGSNT